MPTTIISKEMTFDCAHMLSGHNALCSNLHGHTYKVQVLLKDIPVDMQGTSSDEMVMDFKDLKDLMNKHIMSRFDHAVIFSDGRHRNKAEEGLLSWAMQNEMRYVVLPCRTTAESMAAYMACTIKNAFIDAGVPLEHMPEGIGVRLWETPTSCVEVFV